MTRARNLSGLSTVTGQPTTTTPVNLGPLGVGTFARIYGTWEHDQINAVSVAATSLQVSGITTGLNVSGIITAQNGLNVTGNIVNGLNVSAGIATFAGNVDVNANVDISGNLTVAGTVTNEDYYVEEDALPFGMRDMEEEVQEKLELSANFFRQQQWENFPKFGSGGKIEITHSGGAGIIDNKTANLNIKTSASERISLSPAGAESLTVAHGGNVGIGTNDPQKKLDIAGGGIRLDNSQGIFFATNDSNISRVSIVGDESSDFIQLKVDNSNSHILRLNTTGVGIGTSTPSSKLTVEGNISASGNIIT